MPPITEAVAVLERTPAVLRSMLAELPESWSSYVAAEGSWSPYDVLGHLLHGERTDWIPRLAVILEHGSAVPFTPFDREGMRGSAPDLTSLLADFTDARASSLRALAEAALTPADLDRVGRHPDLGEVTLGELLASWAVHDLSHIAQIAETMAKRYRVEVGPWRAYLPVLDREELTD
ncbi:MAG TPA: DinB family protein [Mycobacteriales bacterium]|nr:DinB family protein [Mycobacteriales bacterium]